MADLTAIVESIGIIVTAILAVVGWYILLKSSFSMVVDPTSGTAVLGGVIPTTVTVEGTKYKHPIHLDALDLPKGITVTFSRGEVIPKSKRWYTFYKTVCSSTVTIVASATIPGNEYLIKIKGRGSNGYENSCTYNLICLNAKI